MAEGPLVHYYASRLKKVLEGRHVTIEFGVRNLKPLEASVRNVRVSEVEAHGKQFRIWLSDGRLLLVHLMMWGSWGIYRGGQVWERPPERARAVLRTRTHEAVVFSAPVVRLLTAEQLKSHPKWGNVGPDPLRDDFSRRDFYKRLNSHPERPIGEALLDQTIISGVGNILRIEALFRAGVHPKRRVAGLSRNEKSRILKWIVSFMECWLKDRKSASDWMRIYGRSGKPCPRCGERIESFRQGGRLTIACPGCQL